MHQIVSVPVKRRFVGTVVEHLQELTSPQMEHELGVDAEIVRQAEACRVLLPVISELLAKTDKHSIEPAQNIG